MNEQLAIASLSLLALAGCRTTSAQTAPRSMGRDCRTLRQSARILDVPRAWTRSTHADAINSPAVRRTCEAVAAETQAQLQPILARPPVLDCSGLGRCANATQGAWILSVRMGPPRESASEGTADLVGEWSAEYIDEQGARIASGSARGPIERALQGASAANILAVHDIDGDGVGELVVEQSNWDEEGSSAPRQAICTARSRSVSAYATGTTSERFALVDADLDQRIDLQIDSEFFITPLV
jgi:hypothetical protein